MRQGTATPELGKMIAEERMLQAERRRAVARHNSRCDFSESKALRMALGPGIQFGSVNDRVLGLVTGRAHGPMVR